MKKFFLFLFFLSIFVILFAQVSNIVTNSDKIIFQGRDAFYVNGNTICLVYAKESEESGFCLYFAKSNNQGENFSETFVDSLSSYYSIKETVNPKLSISGNNVYIYYSYSSTPTDFVLKMAKSVDFGETFEIVSIDQNVIQDFSLLKNQENRILLYFTGKRKDLTDYCYYTYTEMSENEDMMTEVPFISFTGYDHLEGDVFSNSVIHIYDILGGPQFDGFLSSASSILYYPDGGHLSDPVIIENDFPYGSAENTFGEIYQLNNDYINNAIHPFENINADIIRVKVNGNSVTSKIGTIQELGTFDFPVYSWYPKNAQDVDLAISQGYNWLDPSNIIYTNHVTLYDTIWTDGPSFESSGNIIYVDNADLWIDGVVSGKQVWISEKNTYLTGDITYQNTPLGENPDGSENGNINQNDFFALISNKKIIIKYKFKDPLNDFVLNQDNCDNIYLYGIYAALEPADSTQYPEHFSHYDGTFTFEYQHPHGSTPDFVAPSPYTGNDTLYSYVDLHKFIYPYNQYVMPDIFGYNIHSAAPVSSYNMCGYPYESPDYMPGSNVAPYGTDYPWYNPVWPESAENIVTERGRIYLYGAIYQRRRGFVHRSGSDTVNHPDGNYEYSLDDFLFGGTHPSVGYSREYKYDRRLKNHPFADLLSANLGGIPQKIHIKKIDNSDGQITELYQQPIITTIQSNAIFSYEGYYLSVFQNAPSSIEVITLSANGEVLNSEIIDFSEITNYLTFKNIQFYNGNLYLLGSGLANNCIIEFLWDSHTYQILGEFAHTPSDMLVIPNGKIIYAAFANGNIDFYYSENSDFQMLDSISYSSDSAKEIHLSLKTAEDMLYTTIFKDNLYGEQSEVDLLKTDISALHHNDNNITPTNKVYAVAYPNPFEFSLEGKNNGTVRIALYLPKTVKVKVEIYNIKGEKVKSLANCKFNAGKNVIEWNGVKDNGKKASSGVYFYKISYGKNIITHKFTIIR